MSTPTEPTARRSKHSHHCAALFFEKVRAGLADRCYLYETENVAVGDTVMLYNDLDERLVLLVHDVVPSTGTHVCVHFHRPQADALLAAAPWPQPPPSEHDGWRSRRTLGITQGEMSDLIHARLLRRDTWNVAGPGVTLGAFQPGERIGLVSDCGQRIDVEVRQVTPASDGVVLEVAFTPVPFGFDSQPKPPAQPDAPALLVCIAQRPNGAPPLVNFLPYGPQQGEQVARHVDSLPTGTGALTWYAIENITAPARHVGPIR